MKKLPIIGLVIGAVAVFFAKMRKKSPEPEAAAPSEVPPATED